MSPRNYVVITVGDDGAGMDEQMAARVFEPFFTTKEGSKGIGLGLSQVHGFCKQAGGAARLYSTPGLGTTVTMLLPASDGLAVPPAALPAASAAIAGARVLLVEDDDDLGDVTAKLLQAHGAHVERAADAAQALRLLDTQAAFDVVLSDAVMPGPLDGLALGRKLRLDRPTLPFVLISGYMASEAQASGFVVLRKPCSQTDLLAALHNAIAAAQPAPHSPSRR